MSGWKLSELAARIEGSALGGEDVRVSGIAIDSRRVEPGELFAALPGAKTDGSRFIAEALSRGAAALLLPAAGPEAGDAPCLLCPRPRQAASCLAQFMAGDPSEKLRLLGVTGTNGKSTCAHLLQHLLGSAQKPWGLMGTLRCETGVQRRVSSQTTPDPLSLASLLAESLAAGCEGVSMEVSSHALDQDRVAGCRFAGVLYTNLSRDHLDYHGDMDRYFAAKRRLLELLRPGAPALINRDDPRFATLLDPSAPARLSFGRDAGAVYRIRDEKLSAAGGQFTLEGPQGVLDCVMRLSGAFNVSNAAGSLALALALGYDPARLVARLADFPGVPGRMENVSLAGGPKVLIDFAHTPDAIERVLTACRPLCRGRLRALLGAGGDRDQGKRPLMARAAQRLADVVYLTSDNPRSEDPEAILKDLEMGMDRSAGSWHKEVDRARAIRRALADCRREDLLVLLGKGHEESQEIAGRFFPFSDREAVLSAWQELGARR